MRISDALRRGLAPLTALALIGGVGALPGCGGDDSVRQNAEGGRSRSMEGSSRPEDDRGRCDVNQPDREVSEMDTSGDSYPDIRRVYRRIGRAPLIRLILACREADLNHDGIKDVVRYYNDEGRPLREEADRNFDGTMDIITFYQDGRIVRVEQDNNADGRVDTKLFYEDGDVVRTERDLGGRSTATQWTPDRWEYFEDGRMVRMGTDLDGDGNVDRWDRDGRWDERRREEDNANSIDEAVEDTPDEDGGEDAPAEEAS